MIKLRTEQYPTAQPLFDELAGFNLSVGAVLAGTAPGEVWVDDPDRPHVGFGITSEGHYLAGDPDRESSYPALRQLIPYRAYLTVHPDGWEKALDRIWDNPFARRHPRQCIRLRELRFRDWKVRIPDGFELVRVDRDFLLRTDLGHYHDIADRVDEWVSAEYFFARGFGFCLVHENTIASRCVADCVLDDKCEVGVGTDIDYRQLGLAAIVVAAAVEHCLGDGITEIGWHCLGSNAGSIAVAEKVGFVKLRDYAAYSSGMPVENATDLSTAEYEEWARHFERSRDRSEEVREHYLWHAMYAAGAWALAGDATRSMSSLRKLRDSRWKANPGWIEARIADHWMFASLREQLEFRAILAELYVRARMPSQSHHRSAIP